MADEKKEVEEEDKEAQEENDTLSALDRADQIAERQKRENDRREELLTREEALEARRKIGGVTEAGKPAEKKEQSDADYAKDVMEGKYNEQTE